MANGIGRRPGLGFGTGQLGGHLVEGSPDQLVGLHQPLPAGPELLDLDHGQISLAGQFLQDPVPRGLGPFDGGLTFRFGLGPHGLGLLAGLVAQPVGFHPGCFSYPAGDRFRFFGALPEHGLGLAAQGVGLRMSLLQDPGGVFLSPTFEIGCCFVSAPQDVGGLFSHQGEERLLVQPRVSGPVLGGPQCILEGGLALVHRQKLGTDLAEERSDLIGIEPAARRAKALLGDEISRKRPVRKIHSIARHGLSVRRSVPLVMDPS